MKIKSLFFLGLLAAGKLTSAQSSISGIDHGNHNHNHNHGKNEIGVANSPVYLINEKEFSYGLHLHYIRNIKNSKFGVGLGYERIFDEHNHNTIGPVVKFSPAERWSFNFSPGIMVEDDELTKPDFSMHIETVYEFEIKRICIGPAFEFAYSAKDLHVSLGLHLGITF